ncbi:P-loop containing nucleoside triphosphate hydrolase protein [Pisolithus orientalis]|uniref:P-loop containing nucleoside triphosphate hydrolase protein n=1 Tax=Pisolithus orientalis TaxID=936130 RepID=UPI00222509E6|nr:P-loop containing nucleoside triphosphate hydrolase protein [Pisolithus orientalis]KAI5987742.1 P-loop containing nucleoside triphosphate hydrolase protein [Pisolithus orientalis]
MSLAAAAKIPLTRSLHPRVSIRPRSGLARLALGATCATPALPLQLRVQRTFRPTFSHAYSTKHPGGGNAGGGFPGFAFQQPHQKGDALKEYSVDLTEMARNGKLDPVIGRDEEIRRTIQILSRRTKSNPVLIGPPGVGKTAIIEGLASRIVAGEVPESLQDKRVLSLDLSAILAGSGIRGQFEEKFKALIRDIEEEAGKIICFIDEVHMLFNLGKAEGSVDGGQMIKPALARGLRLVGATTTDEYRKTIGKDAALERRFQPVQIDEPTVESTVSILRGLKPRYEVHHGVEIADSALVTAAVYSARYISDRYLPDKAIDLVDEAASALRLAQESKPDELEALDREIMTLQIELESLKKETDVFSVERRAKLESDLQRKKGEAEELTAIWQNERARLDRIKDLKKRLEDAKHELEVAQRQGQYERASQLRFGIIPDLEHQLPKDGEPREVDEESPLAMLHDRVTSNDIARVVAKATGIPVQNLLKGEREKLVHMEESLKQRVVGQDHAVVAVSDAVRISRAGLQAPNRPVASFLFLGPTGVGKTELSKALAGFLFNDEQRGLITVNMSEFHDRHTVSRLIGAAPGYVGFEEGGQLTEAVRRKPYAVILLDELEKAHKDVSMILLQILDEGSLTDSQGRKVDFKNTIVCLTSNIGSDILAQSTSCDANGTVTDEAKALVMKRTSDYFPPELLNRLDSILVFNKLSPKSILDIVSLRLRDVASRLRDRRITLDVDDATKHWLAKKGYSEVYGARAIARVVRSDVLFPLAQKLLKGTIRNGDTVHIRAMEGHDNLQIQDNHPADPSIAEKEEPSIV